MKPLPPEKGAFRIQTIDNGIIVATSTKRGNMDENASHQHNQSTKRWGRASTRTQSLRMLNMEEPLPIIEPEKLSSNSEPTHKGIMTPLQRAQHHRILCMPSPSTSASTSAPQDKEKTLTHTLKKLHKPKSTHHHLINLQHKWKKLPSLSHISIANASVICIVRHPLALLKHIDAI